MTEKLHLIVCENHAAEVKAVISAAAFEDVTVRVLPSHCNTPRTREELLFAGEIDAGDRGILLGGNCLAGCPFTPPLHPRIQAQPERQCLEMVLPPQLIADYQRTGAYLATPGWLAHWRSHIDEWGFDRRTAREFFAESATRVALLDTGVDDHAAEHLAAFADFVGQPAETIPVGLDYLRNYLNGIVLRWQLETQRREAASTAARANRQVADYAAVFDVLQNLAGIPTEKAAVAEMFNLFAALFAPGSAVYLPIEDSLPGSIETWPSFPGADPAAAPRRAAAQRRLADFREKHAWTESERGFRLRIGPQDNPLGIIELDHLAFPEHRVRYLNLALAVTNVFAVSIINARIFERLRASQERLAASEVRYRTLFESTPVGIGIATQDGRIVTMNESMRLMIGYSDQEAAAIHLESLYERVGDRARLLNELRATGHIRNFETRLKRRDRSLFDASLTVTPIALGGQDLLMTVAEDITARKRTELALLESEERYRTIFETAGVAILEEDFSAVKQAVDELSTQGTTDFERYLDEHPEFVVRAAEMIHIVDLNRAALEMFGALDEADLARKLDRMFLPETLGILRDEIVAIARGQTFFQGETVNQTMQGERLDVMLTMALPAEAARFDSVLVSLMDITKLKQAEAVQQEYSDQLEEMVAARTQELEIAQERLLHREKLTVLGQLAGSVGHELRNPLGTISNAVYFLRMLLADADATVGEFLEIIDTEVRTSDAIIHDLLDFGRMRPSEPMPFPVTTLVAEVLQRHPAPPGVQVYVEIPDDLPDAYVDAQQIALVLNNLITNAYQAMVDGGSLRIRARAVRRTVAISITDTGSGISAQHLDRVFEPLFTTKKRGIGLGLALSKDLVGANDGTITVVSTEGEGSTFTVSLPTVPD
jgi:PAS domain S-box-containing protein